MSHPKRLRIALSAGWPQLTPFFHGRHDLLFYGGHGVAGHTSRTQTAKTNVNTTLVTRTFRYPALWPVRPVTYTGSCPSSDAGDWLASFEKRVAAAAVLAAAALVAAAGARSSAVPAHCTKCGTQERGTQWQHGRDDGVRLCSMCRSRTAAHCQQRIALGYRAPPCGGCKGGKRARSAGAAAVHVFWGAIYIYTATNTVF